MKAIPVRTEAGHQIYIEVEEAFTLVATRGGTVAGKSKATELVGRLQDAGDAIADVCRTLQVRIEQALGASKPSELTLEFGVKFAGEAGLPLVTKGSVEGTFQVTAKWNFSEPSATK